MAKRGDVIEPEIEQVVVDEIEEAEAEQAAVGSLFSLQGPEFSDIEWSIHRYRNRQETALDPSGNKHEWVADVVGDLHGADLVAQVGGGTFRFLGYRTSPDGKYKRIVHNKLITLAGPRKNFAYEPPPAQIVAPAAQPQNDALARLLEKINERLDRIERTPPPAPPPGPTLKDMAETMVLLKSLNPETPPVANADREIVNAYVEVLKQGIALGQVREPVEEGGTDWAKVLETASPLVERIFTRRRPQGPPTGSRPVSAAQPAQPGDGTPQSVPTEEQGDPAERARWLVLIDSLARALTQREDPADFADRVESILQEDEVTLLRMSKAEEIMAQLAAHAGERYPVLATPGAKDYVAQVLAELNSAPSDDSEPSPAA
jgi:hypothetical protein